MIKQVKSENLTIGMYVHHLDRPWFETSFLSHKFLIKSSKQIEDLRKQCRHIFIDTEKGLDSTPVKEIEKYEGIQEVQIRTARADKEKEKTSVPNGDNLRKALEVYNQAKETVSSIFKDIRLGKSLQADGAQKTVNAIIESVIEDKDALLCLLKMKTQDEYTVKHSINVSIISLAFGRDLELGENDLQILGLGTLMHDIGKARIPLEILNKPGRLTDSEFEIMKHHVLLGKNMLEEMGHFHPQAMQLVLEHHERKNGRGYPVGLKEDEISLFGRITAIVDVYDAITSQRVYQGPVSPNEAIKRIFEWSAQDFDQSLVERFIKSIGIYPAGSLVEINQSDIGMVLATNQENTLRPFVLVIMDSNKQKYRPPRIINLTDRMENYNNYIWSVTKLLGPLKEEYLSEILESTPEKNPLLMEGVKQNEMAPCSISQ